MNYRNSILSGAAVLALFGTMSLATPALAKHTTASTTSSDAQEDQTTAQLNEQQLNGGTQTNGSGNVQNTMGNGSPATSADTMNSTGTGTDNGTTKHHRHHHAGATSNTGAADSNTGTRANATNGMTGGPGGSDSGATTGATAPTNSGSNNGQPGDQIQNGPSGKNSPSATTPH